MTGPWGRHMVHDKQEAERALRCIDDAERRMTRAVHYGRSGRYLVVWGAVWLAGYLASFFRPETPTVIWTTVTLLGWVATLALVTRDRVSGRAGAGDAAARYAASAAALSVFALGWVFLLTSASPTRYSVYAGTVVGCATVIAGLWRGPALCWLGLAVTALFIAGLSLPVAVLPLYAALVGGGGLVGSGLLLSRRDPL